MASGTERWPGRLALMVAHCAGMVDLIALPVWVGTLVAHYRLDPQQAGGLATLFLVGAMASSLVFAPRFQRLSGRLAASLGYGLAALAFFAAAQVQQFAALAVLHALAGIGAGCGLSVTHGTIGRSARPHRLFAVVGTALGVFGIVFLGATPALVARHGGPALFWAFGGVMAVAALVAAAAFPAVLRHGRGDTPSARPTPIGAAVWCGIAGLSAMSLVQAMTFSFLERVGAARGFGLEAITGVLIALGFVNLAPAALAAALERRCPARRVLRAGPLLHAALAMLVMHSHHFVGYAAGALFIAGVMIFTHTFAFGLLARLDPSGRTTAATPAMLMVGSAIGPVLGGTLVKAFGYEAIRFAAGAFAVLAVACFHRMLVPAAPRPVTALP